MNFLCVILVADGRRRSELGSGHELRVMDSISQLPGRSIGSDGQVVLVPDADESREQRAGQIRDVRLQGQHGKGAAWRDMGREEAPLVGRWKCITARMTVAS